MKFHLKITLSMLALLSLLFGTGSSLLISASFRESLEREEATAFSSYHMAWGTLQIVGRLKPYLDRETLAQTMEQLDQQSETFWTSLRLTFGEEIIYGSGRMRADSEIPPVSGTCLIQISGETEGHYYLVFSGTVETDGDLLCFTASHCISDLYTARDAQQRTCFRILLVMWPLCGILSYAVSRLLTAPLKELSQASRLIASGNYASRVRVRSQDEIGVLSQDFNTMAEQLEANAEQKEHYIEQLCQSAEQQERFTGSFAHELKTPMTALVGYADLLRSGTLTPEEQAEAAGYLYSEGKRLESLSRKLLELLVIRQQGLSLIPASPGALVEQLTYRLEPICRERGIHLTCECEDGLCLIEPDLVWSLLLNLTDNAQKAMEGGGELHIQLELLADGCRILVLDSGRGIPPEALTHLTEAFYRADKARSRKQGGFGLGLALCREIISLHNGSIEFANRPEGGVCVTVELRGGRP